MLDENLVFKDSVFRKATKDGDKYRGTPKKVVRQDRRDLRSRTCGRVNRDLRGFVTRIENTSKEYWSLVRKLAACEKERDIEREKVRILEEIHWEHVRKLYELRGATGTYDRNIVIGVRRGAREEQGFGVHVDVTATKPVNLQEKIFFRKTNIF